MGVRGLCNGLGPALFGLMFYLFGIDVTEPLIDDSKIHLDPITHLELLPHFALVSNQTYPPTTYRNISTKDWSREGLEVSNVTTIGIVQVILITFIYYTKYSIFVTNIKYYHTQPQNLKCKILIFEAFNELTQKHIYLKKMTKKNIF